MSRLTDQRRELHRAADESRLVAGVASQAQVQLFQVDERVAPAGDAARNLTHIQASLLDHAPLPAANVHAMPVEAADLPAAARDYAATLQRREVGGRWPRSSDSPCRFRVRRSCRPTGKEVYHLRAAVALVDWP